MYIRYIIQHYFEFNQIHAGFFILSSKTLRGEGEGDCYRSCGCGWWVDLDYFLQFFARLLCALFAVLHGCFTRFPTDCHLFQFVFLPIHFFEFFESRGFECVVFESELLYWPQRSFFLPGISQRFNFECLLTASFSSIQHTISDPSLFSVNYLLSRCNWLFGHFMGWVSVSNHFRQSVLLFPHHLHFQIDKMWDDFRQLSFACAGVSFMRGVPSGPSPLMLRWVEFCHEPVTGV